MKKVFILLTLLIIGINVFTQNSVMNFKTKNSSNATDRTIMLNILRSNLLADYKQEFVFVVNHFKVYKNYAWFRGNAQRKDGKNIVVDEGEDCCHVEALFKKENNKWKMIESGAFSTDVWYIGIWDKLSVPKEIFE